MQHARTHTCIHTCTLHMQTCTHTHTHVLRAGYECKEFDGSFMAAFPDGCAAMEWALTLQMALLALPWAQVLRVQCAVCYAHKCNPDAQTSVPPAGPAQSVRAVCSCLLLALLCLSVPSVCASY